MLVMIQIKGVIPPTVRMLSSLEWLDDVQFNYLFKKVLSQLAKAPLSKTSMQKPFSRNNDVDGVFLKNRSDKTMISI